MSRTDFEVACNNQWSLSCRVCLQVFNVTKSDILLSKSPYSFLVALPGTEADRVAQSAALEVPVPIPASFRLRRENAETLSRSIRCLSSTGSGLPRSNFNSSAQSENILTHVTWHLRFFQSSRQDFPRKTVNAPEPQETDQYYDRTHNASFSAGKPYLAD